MNDAVFISDLHLHPERPDIFQKFQSFVAWAAQNTRSVYILGDFLHVWPGDEAMNAWSESIADSLASLVANNIPVYMMPGNRDFLLGPVFIERAKVVMLPDPFVIVLGDERVLLTHGDQYCTKDRSHQWLRKVTRNAYFNRFFLCLPYALRLKLVNQVRRYSRENIRKPKDTMNIVNEAMFADLTRFSAISLIHGHTHQPGLKVHYHNNSVLKQYTLSDWDENPAILCYNNQACFFSDILGDIQYG